MFVIKHICTGEYLSAFGWNRKGHFARYKKDRDDAIEFFAKEYAEKALQDHAFPCPETSYADEQCTVLEEAALSSGFNVMIETVDKHWIARGSLFIEGEGSQRKFTYHSTHRHMKPRGCEGAWDSPVPAGALRTVPPGLQKAVGRKKFVRIFNLISDAMWSVLAYNDDASKESIFSPQAKQQIAYFHHNPPKSEGIPFGPEDSPPEDAPF